VDISKFTIVHIVAVMHKNWHFQPSGIIVESCLLFCIQRRISLPLCVQFNAIDPPFETKHFWHLSQCAKMSYMLPFSTTTMTPLLKNQHTARISCCKGLDKKI